MATATTRPTNGVSFGYIHTVTSTDVSDGSAIIDFQVDYMLAAVVMITNALNEGVNDHDAVITYPANGQVSIATGNSLYTLTAGHKIHVVANRLSS
jgi:hypothetical protein